MEKNQDGSVVHQHSEVIKKEQSDENESSYSFTTVSTSESGKSAEVITERYEKDTNSQDSAMVSEWVDKELEKIKRRILKESSESLEDRGFTEDVIIAVAKRQETSDSAYQSAVEKKKSIQKFKVKGKREKVEQIGSRDVEEFYFDDEIHANMGMETHMQLSESFEILSSKENQPRSRKAPKEKLRKAVPDKPHIMEKRDYIAGIPQQRKENRRTSKIPVVKGTSTSKNNEGSYENIYTLRSSLSNIGQHTLTHSLKDLSTGETCTVAHETFEAGKVITNFIGD